MLSQQSNVFPKPAKQVQIDTWEGEGGATEAVVFGRPRPLHKRAMTRLECVAYKLTRRVRSKPLQALAVALGVGILVGASARGVNALTALGALRTLNDLST